MLPRITEEQLFNYWRLIHKGENNEGLVLSFQDICVDFCQSVGFCIFGILELFKILNIDFKTLEFNEEEFSFYYEKEKNYVDDFLEKNRAKASGRAIENVLNNKFSKNDLKELVIIPKEISPLLNSIYFTVDKVAILEISNFLNTYIDAFIQDNLLMEDYNFYDFKHQKEIIRAYFKDNLQYGKTFIMRYDPADIFFTDSAFLFIHTLLAFEKLEYLKVEELYTFSWLEDLQDHTEDYKAKVFLNNSFYSDYYNKDENEIVKHNEEDREINFDGNILFFQGKEFNFSNSPNQCELLRTLFKDIGKVWHCDEIQEDWDPTCYEERLKQKDYWKKFYNSAREINKKIAIETGIKDFLLMNTKQVRVNKKYK